MSEKKKKVSKPRAAKYEKKFSLNGTFDEIIKVAVKAKKKTKE